MWGQWPQALITKTESKPSGTSTPSSPEESWVSHSRKTGSNIRAHHCIQVAGDYYRLDSLPEQKAVRSNSASPRQGK